MSKVETCVDTTTDGEIHDTGWYDAVGEYEVEFR